MATKLSTSEKLEIKRRKKSLNLNKAADVLGALNKAGDEIGLPKSQQQRSLRESIITKPKPKIKDESKNTIETNFKSPNLIEKAKSLVKTVAKTEAKEQGKKESFFNDDLITKAGLAIIPTIIGGLLGGTEGAAIGLKAGAEGVQQLDEGKATEVKAAADERKSIREEAGKEELRQSKVELNKAKIQSFSPEAIAAKLKLKGVKPLNESQAKARIFGLRTRQAEKVFTDLKDKGVDFSDVFSTKDLPNAAQTNEAQQFNQAKRNFLNAVLRKESGAKISEEEFISGEKQYFPLTGDSPEVLRQKEENRKLVTQQLLLEGQVDTNELQTIESRSELERLRARRAKGEI